MVAKNWKSHKGGNWDDPYYDRKLHLLGKQEPLWICWRGLEVLEEKVFGDRSGNLFPFSLPVSLSHLFTQPPRNFPECSHHPRGNSLSFECLQHLVPLLTLPSISLRTLSPLMSWSGPGWPGSLWRWCVPPPKCPLLGRSRSVVESQNSVYPDLGPSLIQHGHF